MIPEDIENTGKREVAQARADLQRARERRREADAMVRKTAPLFTSMHAFGEKNGYVTKLRHIFRGNYA